MPSINFKAQFAGAVEHGRKNQTIRSIRERPIEAGEMLSLYTGLRSKKARLLKKVPCRSVTPIQIWRKHIILDGRPLSWSEMDDFARADGFSRLEDLFDFFESQYGRVFEGVLIKW